MSKFMEEKFEKLKADNLTFYSYLHEKGDSDATFIKYQKIVNDFISYFDNQGVAIQDITKTEILDYAKYLKENTKKITTCNNKLSILNVYFTSITRKDLIVELFRTVKINFIEDNKYLEMEDFRKLEEEAKSDITMDAILHTFAGLGIRVSELQFVTYEAVKDGEITIENKKKIRTIAIPHKLRTKLLDYCRIKGIKSGYLFTFDGIHPYSRGTIWHKLKTLAKKAGVILSKVFPHALRHLFARLNYEKHKDLESLKTILGHSMIATTLLYLMKTKAEYANKVDNGLLE